MVAAMTTTDSPMEPVSMASSPGERESTRAPIRRSGRRNGDVLGLAWLHGTLQAAVFRRQVSVGSWTAPHPVRTIEEWEAGLDAALEALGFCGTEVFLILEHDQFVHQAELAPAFTESATRAYLRGRVQRYEKEKEPMLWINQRTVSTRKESAFLLHMLPAAFYAQLSRVLLMRHLDLTRILPLIVPLQLLLEAETATEQMVLMAAEAGDATTLLVAKSTGELLFSRTMLARWETDAARIAVEVNRSLLYAKQQFGAIVDRVELLGAVSEQVQAEVRSRCGAEKQLEVRVTDVQSWLQAVARLSPRHPVNLVVGYLGRKRRRQFLRRLLLAACWLGLSLVCLDTWSTIQAYREGERQLQNLRSQEASLSAERGQLSERSWAIAHDRQLIREASSDRLPPVAVRFLAYLGSTRPPEMQFTEFSTKWDPASGAWSFKLGGLLEGDDETARENLATWQRLLSKSTVRAHFNESARVFILMPAVTADAPPVHRFSVEGGLLED